MAKIDLAGLAHAYRPNPVKDSDYALRPLTLTWDDGGAYALLGPSGCGKTTLLNIISGLITPTRGQVLFDGKDMTRESPQARNIAQVFQFPVIYDTMTVFDNLAFPLRNRNVADDVVRRRVGQVAEMLELSADLNRRASGLTADAKQKISLGRGLVRSDVAAILFDEPLTVIDPHLKWQLRRKLKQIHKELKLTLLYVTHDQIEALTFADKVVVMSEGQVVQSGTAEDLFDRPAHTFVGHFIGSPGMNLLPCAVKEGALAIGGQVLINAIDATRMNTLRERAADTKLTLGIRPEYVMQAVPNAPGALMVRVLQSQDIGTHRLLTARVGEHVIRAKLPPRSSVSGDEAWLSLVNARTCFYANEVRIA